MAHGGSMPGAHWSGLEQQTSEGIITDNVPLEAIVRKTFEKTKTICLHTYGCAPELVLTGPEYVGAPCRPLHKGVLHESVLHAGCSVAGGGGGCRSSFLY